MSSEAKLPNTVIKRLALYAQNKSSWTGWMLAGLHRFERLIIEAPSCIRKHAREHPYLFTMQVIGLLLFITSVALLPALGFTALGPAAGGIAAGWQAGIGSVANGSLFAFLQSAAMGGAAAGLFTAAGIVGVAMMSGPEARWILKQLGKATFNWSMDLGVEIKENIGRAAEAANPGVHKAGKSLVKAAKWTWDTGMGVGQLFSSKEGKIRL